MGVPIEYKYIDNFFFYDTIANLNIKYVPNKLDNYQNGGKRFDAIYGKHTFDMSIEKLNKYTHISILTKDDTECVSVYIFKNNPIASLNNMTYSPDCAIEGLERPGSRTCSLRFLSGGKIFFFLLEFIVAYLKEYKNEYNINKIILKDNSYISCNSCNSGLPLARLKMITQNSTWYMNHGFTLCDSKGESNELTQKLLSDNKKALSKIKSSDVDFKKIGKKMQTSESKYIFDPKEFNRLYKKYIMIEDLINMLAMESNKYCCLISYILEELFHHINRKKYDLYDFYQQSYCMKL